MSYLEKDESQHIQLISISSCNPKSIFHDDVTGNRNETLLNVSAWSLRRARELANEQVAPPSESRRHRFTAALSDNNLAEQELSAQLSRADFETMQVLGQFNLGFIVTKLGNELFIVDQHASDEKFNFELGAKSETFVCQKLVVPRVSFS